MKIKNTFLLLFLFGASTLLGQLPIQSATSSGVNINEEPVTEIYTLVKSDINDLDNWLKEMETHFAESAAHWGKHTFQNYEAIISSPEGQNLPNVLISIRDQKGNEIWQTKTNNQGRAMLWAKPNVEVAFFFIQYRGKVLEQPVFSDQFEYQFVLEANCDIEKSLDLMVVMDATGSMRNELEFLKTEWWEVLDELKMSNEIEVREGVVFYRDYYEAFVTRSMPLGSKPEAIDAFVNSHAAVAGGDNFEVVIEALEEAVYNQKWNANAVARVVVIMLDAPPRNIPDLYERWDKLLRSASSKGIQIVPVVGLKAFGDLEYMMRSAALATNGICFFLSQQKMHDVKEETEVSKVVHLEWLKELLIQVLDRSTVSICEEENAQGENSIGVLVEIYPNPCADYIFLTLSEDISGVFLSNTAGVRWPLNDYKAGQHRIDLNTYPSGTFILSGSSEFGEFQKKIIIQQ